MMPRWPQRGRIIVVVAVSCLYCTSLFGQSATDDVVDFAAATLPESNEALLLSSRIEEAIGIGNYRLAIEQIERLMRLSEGLVAAPATRTYYPIWRQAFRLLAQMPTAGIELYRRMYDAEVEARFRQATADSDVDALRELFRGYRLSSDWEAVGIELAARLLDDGAHGEAIEVLREIAAAGVGLSKETKLQLGVSLACMGARRSAVEIVAELNEDPELGEDPEWLDRLRRVEDWLDLSGMAGRVGFAPAIETGAVWYHELDLGGSAEHPGGGQDLAEAIEVLRTLPLHQPLVGGASDELLLIRMAGQIAAFELETLFLKWTAAEQGFKAELTDLPRQVAGAGQDNRPRLPAQASDLMWNHLRHAVSVGFGMVYTVEQMPGFGAGGEVIGRGGFQIVTDNSARNELVARDLDSGRVVWRTSEDAVDDWYDVVFQNVPIAFDGRLVVPLRRGDSLSLAVLTPEEGRLLQEVPLIGPPTRFPSKGGRCLLIDDATTLYVCTGNGVIAALARDGLGWRWATVYPSTLAEHLGQLWWQPLTTSAEPNVDSPIIADDLLIVAPVDSGDVFGLDRFDGRERWRMPRSEYPYLIGTVSGGLSDGSTGLVLGGREVICLDLEDPDPGRPKWRSVPLKITGRSAIEDGRIFVPTDEGIVTLDGGSGKVIGDQQPGRVANVEAAAGDESPMVFERDVSANLVVAGESLLSVSPGRIVKYPDPRRTRESYAERVERPENEKSRALVLGWLDAIEGDYEEALSCGVGEGGDDPRLAVARNQLLRYVYLGLARAAPAGKDRVSWLKRASSLADTPQSAVELAVSMGEVLESSGDWAGAVLHYGRMLRESDATALADRSQTQRHMAGWLCAARRIEVLRDRVSPKLLEELVDECLLDEERRSLNLQRLRVALADENDGGRLNRLLCLLKIAPELKLGCLPRDDRDWSKQWRRRMLLEQWDVHVSLDLMEAAARDRGVWEAEFADQAGGDKAGSEIPEFARLTEEEERDRVYAIDLAARKLSQVEGQLFTDRVTRQWKIEQGELLVDPRRPLSAVRPWILAANLEGHRIELVNAYKHQHPQRQTEDGLSGTGEQISIGLSGQVWEGRRFEWEGGQRETWPVVMHGHLAAVPTRGGLVCVGLGPERYAGRRQWEYPVTDWTGVPVGFAERAVAGERGVYFCPRRDRVALVGWFDGQLWWQWDLPGVIVERLYLSDEELVIVSNDQQVWVTDATHGRELVSVATGQAPPRLVDVVGDTIVLWSDEAVSGVSAKTRRELWSRPIAPVTDTAVVPGRSWIAYRPGVGRRWYLLDGRDGRAVFDTELGEFESISAIVADAERVLVAGSVGELEEEGELRGVRLRAVQSGSGELLWSRDIKTTVGLNPTQLAAHPELIPVLMAGVGGAASRESRLPAIVLVKKDDGELGEPLSIKDDYRAAAEATCEMYMLALPTRIVVQVGGNVIAYGNSPLRLGP